MAFDLGFLDFIPAEGLPIYFLRRDLCEGGGLIYLPGLPPFDGYDCFLDQVFVGSVVFDSNCFAIFYKINLISF